MIIAMLEYTIPLSHDRYWPVIANNDFSGLLSREFLNKESIESKESKAI
jgi:hypothetical protein